MLSPICMPSSLESFPSPSLIPSSVASSPPPSSPPSQRPIPQELLPMGMNSNNAGVNGDDFHTPLEEIELEDQTPDVSPSPGTEDRFMYSECRRPSSFDYSFFWDLNIIDQFVRGDAYMFCIAACHCSVIRHKANECLQSNIRLRHLEDNARNSWWATAIRSSFLRFETAPALLW